MNYPKSTLTKSSDEEKKLIVGFIEQQSLDDYFSIFRIPRNDGGDFVQRKELEYFATIKFDSKSDLDVVVRKESIICKFFSLEFMKENTYSMEIQRKNILDENYRITNFLSNNSLSNLVNNSQLEFSTLKISEELGKNNYSKRVYEKIDKLYNDMQEQSIQKTKLFNYKY